MSTADVFIIFYIESKVNVLISTLKCDTYLSMSYRVGYIVIYYYSNFVNFSGSY